MGLFRRKPQEQTTEETTTEVREALIDQILRAIPNYTTPFANVNEQQALSIPAFWRGVRWKVGKLQKLPLHAYEGRSKLSEQPSLLVQPDPTEPLSVTLSKLTTSLILRGNAFAVLGDFDELGFPRVLKVVHPDHVSFDIERHLYIIGDQEYDPSMVLHIRGLTLAGEVMALSPIEVCRRSLDHAIRVDEFGRRYFADNATPGGAIKVNRANFSAEESDVLKAKWMAAQRGSREPVVLPPDIEFTPFTISNEDSQFLQTKIHSITDVANIVGVPAWTIGGEKPGYSYSNLEADALFLIRDYLDELPALEEAFTSLLPEGVEAKFNLDAELRASTKERYEAHAIALDKGFMTVDEVRELEDREPLETQETDASE